MPGRLGRFTARAWRIPLAAGLLLMAVAADSSWWRSHLRNQTVAAQGSGHLRSQRDGVTLPPAPPGASVVLPADAIRAVDRPHFVPAARARLNPDTPVILVRGQEARAYSLPLLNRYEIVNDTLDGEPIAVTW
jgi:hypothetical protein